MKKVAIITGASSGIGRAIALNLASKGIATLLVGRQEERLQEVRQEILNSRGMAEVLAADVGEDEHAKRIASACMETFGRIDILVNNAGVGHYHQFSDMTAEVYSRITQTNWLGILHATSKVLPYMMDQKDGVIVNISSVGAMTGIPCRSIYCATKAAVRNWSRSLFLELRPYGIHVLCVIPGSTATRFFDNVIGTPPVVHAMPGGVMTPEKAARLIWKGLKSRKREIILSPFGKLVDIINRLSPSFIDALVDFHHRRTVKKTGMEI